MKKECPNCAVEVEEGNGNCPICGYEFSQVKSHHHFFTWVAIILIILFLIPAVALLIRALK